MQILNSCNIFFFIQKIVQCTFHLLRNAHLGYARCLLTSIQMNLLNRMGSVVTWVAWVIIFTWVAKVKYIFALVFVWVKNFYVGPKFFRGSNFFFFFCVGQLLFTRRDYFTILQLIA